ncbi:ADP-ribosylglycohydrolase-domain-containing protein [Flagelloscypha sp. PMI_526]|nr:ADP-ribosylglycohydrolase-domain-containing protein [Flagelloscypha sp. PMI_526]
MDQAQILDKAMGTLIGSALGDTVGLYTEFLTPEQARHWYPDAKFSLIEPTTEFVRDQHRARFDDRAWTDDTDHTLLIVLSVLRNGELSEMDFADRLHTWVGQGLRCLDRLPLGLGKTVGSVVCRDDYVADPAGTALAYWERTGKNIAPNGSLMRTSPVGVMCIQKSEEETFATAIRLGKVTHTDPRCSVSVAIACGLIRALIRDEVKTPKDVDAVIERAWAYTVENESHLIELDRAEFDKHAFAKTLDELVLADRTMGYVYKCLGSALWCLRQVVDRQETFKSAMTQLVMAAGDADTNGAVAGALMGALYGHALLPKEWRDGMKHEQWYREKIQSFCIVSGLIDGEYDAQGDKDTALDGGRGFLGEEEMKQREMKLMEKILLADKERREEAEAKAKKSSSKTQSRFKLW